MHFLLYVSQSGDDNNCYDSNKIALFILCQLYSGLNAISLYIDLTKYKRNSNIIIDSTRHILFQFGLKNNLNTSMYKIKKMYMHFSTYNNYEHLS